MSLNLRIDHGNLKFNLTSPWLRALITSKKQATIQFDCFFRQLFGGNTITASHNVDSILFNETTDVTQTSQMSLTVRYIQESNIREDFIGFVDPHGDVYSDPDLQDDDTSDSELQVSDSGIDEGKDQTETLNATTAAADDVDMDYNIQEPKLNGQVLGKLVTKTLKKIGLN